MKEGEQFYRLTQDGVELLFDEIGDSRKFQLSIEELLLFIENDNSLVWESIDLEKYPGIKSIKDSDKLGYMAIWVEDKGPFFQLSKLLFIIFI